MRLLIIVVVSLAILGCRPLPAEVTIIQWGGKLWHPSGDSPGDWEPVTIVNLDDGGKNPPPPPPTGDKFGLVKLSKERAAAVGEYPKKKRHAVMLQALYMGTASAVESGAIQQAKVKEALDRGFSLLLGSDSARWVDAWKNPIEQAFNNHPGINTKADGVRGLRDIAKGLEQVAGISWQEASTFFSEEQARQQVDGEGSPPSLYEAIDQTAKFNASPAVDWAAIFKFVIEVLIPLLIDLFGDSAVGAMP